MNERQEKSQINLDEVLILLSSSSIEDFIREEKHSSRWSKEEYSSFYDVTFLFSVETLTYKLSLNDAFYPMDSELGYGSSQNYTLEILDGNKPIFVTSPRDPPLWIALNEEYEKLKNLFWNLENKIKIKKEETPKIQTH